MKTKDRHSISRVATTVVLLLLFFLGVWFTDQAQRATPAAQTEPAKTAEPAVSTQMVKLPPWSEVKPANHGTNPIPEGFVQTAVYEDVARLAFPTPASVPAGLRARVILGEVTGATGRFKHVRIEEVARISENRLIERRVMPADHLVVYANKGKTEAEVRAALPTGFVIRKKLYSGTGVSPVSPEPSRRYLIGFESKNADSLAAAAETLKKVPVLTSAVPDGYVFSSSIPNDPLFDQQWGLHNTGQTANGVVGTPDADIDAPEAWDLTTGSSAVTVAVIDSGIDLTHEDLVDNIWKNPGESGDGKETNGIDDDGNGFIDDVNGWDFVNDDNVPQDDFGHGTHVAGIIGAKGNNGVGIAGVCWNVKLASLKALRANGSGLWSDVTEAIEYAKLQKMPIGNLSLGAYGSAPLGVQLTFEEAPEVLFCCAAGNGSLAEAGSRIGDDIDSLVFVPAAFGLGHVISVAAVGSDGLLAPFSNYGRVNVDVGAPGMNVLSTKMSGGYELKSGTSMASAFLAGAAAYLDLRQKYSPLRKRQKLQLGAVRTPRLSNLCATEGRLSLEHTGIQANTNVEWGQLRVHAYGAQDLKTLHLRPDGRIKSWTRNGFENDPSLEGLECRSVFQREDYFDAPFVIGADFNVYAYNHNISYLTPHLEPGIEPFYRLAGLTDIISAAGTFSPTPSMIFLKKDGSVWSLGSPESHSGRGTPPFAGATVPGPIPGLTDIVQIASFYDNHMALRRDGTLFVWGINDSYSHLGLGHTDPITAPVALSGMPPISRFTRMRFAVLCTANDGSVWGWGTGWGFVSQLPAMYPLWQDSSQFQWFRGGTYGSDAMEKPLEQLSDHTFIGNVAFAVPHTVPTAPVIREWLPDLGGAGAPSGIDTYGNIWEWGIEQRSYPIGALQVSPQPVQIPLGGSVMQAASAYGTGTALLADGTVRQWGQHARAGQGINSGLAYVPVQVPEYTGASDIAASPFYFSVGKWADGRLVTLGAHSGSATYTAPFSLPSLSGVDDIQTLGHPYGHTQIAALKSDGSVWKWNRAQHIQNLAAYPPLPGLTWVQESSIDSVIQMANYVKLDSPGTGLLCLRSDGTLRELRRNTDGDVQAAEIPPVPLPQTMGEIRQIQTVLSEAHACAILCENNKVWLYDGTEFILKADLGPSVDFMNFPYVKMSSGQLVLIYGSELLVVPTSSQISESAVAVAHPGVGHQVTGAALLNDGRALTWSAYYGSHPSLLGRGLNPEASEWNAGIIPTLSDGVKLWGGASCYYIQRVDGSVWAWGNNSGGLLGASGVSGIPLETASYSTEILALNSAEGINDWLTTHFSNEELGSINISGDEADPDRDGLVNLVEYALGSNPKAASDQEGDEVGLTASFETVSSEALSADGAGAGVEEGELHFTVKLKRRAKRPGIEYRVEFSDDMVTWHSSPDRLIKVLESERVVIYRDVEPLGVAPKRYARLAIRKGN